MNDQRLGLLIFVSALLACALVTKPHADSWNDRSRFATIESLADRATFAIDGSPFAGTGDAYEFRGRRYSDKPPLLQIQGAAVAAVLKPFGIRLDRSPGAAIYLVTLLTVGLWFAIGLTYAYALQRELGFDGGIALAVTVLTGFATLAISFAGVFANHVPAGAATLAGFFYLRRATAWPEAALGSALLALAVCFDAGAAALALPLAIVLLRRAGASRAVAAVAAALPLLALQLGYNHAVSNGFGPPALDPATWSDPHSPFYGASPQLTRFGRPLSLAYAFDLAFGAQGLFSYSPVALVAIAGTIAMWRSGSPALRDVALAVALACGCYAAATYLVAADSTSWNFGDRRWVDAAFLLCVPIGSALAAARGKPAARIAIVVLVIASVSIAFLGATAPWAKPPGLTSAWSALLVRSRLGLALNAVLGLLAVAAATRVTWLATRPSPEWLPVGSRGGLDKPTLVS